MKTNKTMFTDGLGHPIKLGQTVFINGQQMTVKYGNHVNDSINWLLGAKDKVRNMYGWYAESECGSWEVNLYSKKDQIQSLNELIANQLIQQEQTYRERMLGIV